MGGKNSDCSLWHHRSQTSNGIRARRLRQFGISNKAQDLARVFRAESGKVLAILVAQCQDIQQAEDALQDACLQASQTWADSPPKNAPAWLLTTARRRLIDAFRKSSTLVDQHKLALILDSLDPDQLEPEAEQDIPDERLKLIFTCCHPALNQQSQVALTLRSLCLSINGLCKT